VVRTESPPYSWKNNIKVIKGLFRKKQPFWFLENVISVLPGLFIRQFPVHTDYLCTMSDAIVNRVAQSGLIILNLEDHLPQGEVVSFDLKDYLFMGLILKEKDFREALKNFDWTAYQDKYVAITCTADAIIPLWAYMLVTTYLQPVAKDIYVGTTEEAKKHLFLQNIAAINAAQYTGQRIVVKGCGDISIGAFAYAELTKILLPHVKSIMYGEPCSTVPVFKAPLPPREEMAEAQRPA
jgi:hypothetical protein